jgi:hypothetical protein
MGSLVSALADGGDACGTSHARSGCRIFWATSGQWLSPAAYLSVCWTRHENGLAVSKPIFTTCQSSVRCTHGSHDATHRRINPEAQALTRETTIEQSSSRPDRAPVSTCLCAEQQTKSNIDTCRGVQIRQPFDASPARGFTYSLNERGGSIL